MSEYHIHIDAKWLSPEFEFFLTELLGFQAMDFTRECESDSPHAPDRHLTLKLYDSQRFKDAFRRIKAFLTTGNAMTGHVEGEFVALDTDLPNCPFDLAVPVPWKLKLERLPFGKFRETEIHITMSRDLSDPRLLENLGVMGLFSALIRKPYGMGQVFTVQGSRKMISALLPPLVNYLEAAGGSVCGSIKEERIAAYWLSDPDLCLPPVVASIDWPDAS